MKDTADITSVINALRSICGVGICYYDLYNFFNYFQTGRQNSGHYCDFCRAVRNLPGGRQACEKSDKIEAVALAEQYRQPFFFECHMGMRELVLPLLHDDALLGIVFVGQCRIEGESAEKLLMLRAAEAGGDPQIFLDLYSRLPQLTRENLHDIGSILSLYFGVRIEHSQPLGFSPAAPSTSLAERVRLYIDQHYKNDLSTAIVARHFYVSEAHLSRTFKKFYQQTVTDYIQLTRIHHAEHLLKNTGASIGSITLNVGYTDLNYFSRIFKRRTGLSLYSLKCK